MQDSANWPLCNFPFLKMFLNLAVLLIFGHDICFYFIMKIWREIDPKSPKPASFCPPNFLSCLRRRATCPSFFQSLALASILYLLPSQFFRKGLALSLFSQIGGVCTLKKHLPSVRTERERENFLYSGVREESSKEEGGSARELRVHAPEVGSLNPARIGQCV